MRGTLSSIAMAGAFVSLIAFTAQEADARGGRGGGARGGGASSMSRGGGGGGGGGFSRGGSYSRPSGSYSRPSSGFGGSTQMAGRGGATASQRPAAATGQRPAQQPAQGNRGNINTGNINRGNINTGNINTGNINTGNVNIGNDVNINVDNNYGWGGYYDRPAGGFWAGVAIGATATLTAAAIGSAYYALPPSGCSPYVWQTYHYYHCGSAWYQTRYEGDTIVYVTVSDPSKGTTTTVVKQ